MKTNLIGISGKIGSGKDTVGKILQYLSTVNNPTKEEFIERHINNNHTLVQPKYKIKKYADKLKDIVCLLIGCTREQLEDREFKEKELGEEWVVYKVFTQSYHYNEYKLFNNRELAEKFAFQFHGSDINGRVVTIKLTPRKLLQLLGTDCGRNIIHPQIWVNALFADYKTLGFGEGNASVLEFPNWIITDVRFPNEAQAIKDRGGIVIRVNRDKYFDCTCVTHEEDVKNCFHCDGTGRHLDIPNNEHPSETALDDYEFDHVIDNNGSVEELVEKVKQLKLV